MNTHQKTIDRIKELVPRLMELRFGCDVLISSGYGENKRTTCFKIGHESCGDHKCCIGSIIILNELCLYEIEKIIGFDPDLESVLEAISNDTRIKFAPYQLIHLVQTWEKGKTFSEQSEETKQAITDIFFTQ
jgi:hypothetical protein